MIRLTEHIDIGPSAEHALRTAGDNNRTHFWMLEPDTVQGIVQLDIDAKVIGIQFQLITWSYTAILIDRQGQRRHW